MTYQGSHIQGRPSLTQKLSAVNSSLVSGGTSCPLHPYMLGFVQFELGGDLVCAVTTDVNLYVQLSCCDQTTLFPCSHPQPLALTSLCLLFCSNPEI